MYHVQKDENVREVFSFLLLLVRLCHSLSFLSCHILLPPLIFPLLPGRWFYLIFSPVLFARLIMECHSTRLSRKKFESRREVSISHLHDDDDENMGRAKRNRRWEVRKGEKIRRSKLLIVLINTNWMRNYALEASFNLLPTTSYSTRYALQ